MVSGSVVSYQRSGGSGHGLNTSGQWSEISGQWSVVIICSQWYSSSQALVLVLMVSIQWTVASDDLDINGQWLVVSNIFAVNQ